jgi:hypothetical protein
MKKGDIRKIIFVRFLNSYPELKHKYFPSLLGMGDAELQNSPRLKVNIFVHLLGMCDAKQLTTQGM